MNQLPPYTEEEARQMRRNFIVRVTIFIGIKAAIYIWINRLAKKARENAAS